MVHVIEVDPDNIIDEDNIWFLRSVKTELAPAKVERKIIAEIFCVLDVMKKIAAQYYPYGD